MPEPKEILRITAIFPAEIDLISAKDHLSRMKFVTGTTPHTAKDMSWRLSAQLELNGENITKERVRNVLDMLIGGLGGTYSEES
jgi:hypothetical protein